MLTSLSLEPTRNYKNACKCACFYFPRDNIPSDMRSHLSKSESTTASLSSSVGIFTLLSEQSQNRRNGKSYAGVSLLRTLHRCVYIYLYIYMYRYIQAEKKREREGRKREEEVAAVRRLQFRSVLRFCSLSVFLDDT